MVALYHNVVEVKHNTTLVNTSEALLPKCWHCTLRRVQFEIEPGGIRTPDPVVRSHML
jgi:hypothetical protein